MGAGVVLFGALAANVAWAQTPDTWNGGAVGSGNSYWNAAGNWNNGAPTAETPLVFDGTTGLLSTNNLATSSPGFPVPSVTFNTTAGSFYFYGNGFPLVMSNSAAGTVVGITNNSTSAAQWFGTNFGLSLSNGINVYDAGGGIVLSNPVAGNASSAINGTGGITNVGPGTLVLGWDAGWSLFSGGVTVNNGTVVAYGANGSTGLGNGVATVNSGGTLAGGIADAFGYTSGKYPANIIINGGTVTDLGSANYQITLPNLTFTGGTLTSAVGNTGSSGSEYSFNGNNTTMTINTVAASATATISAGGIITQRQTTFNIAAGTVTGGATPGVDMLVSSVLLPTSGHHGITKTGAGVLELTGASTFVYGVGINGGVIIVGGAQTGSAGPLGGVSNGNDAISFGGGTLRYSSLNAYDYSPRFSTAAGQACSIDTAGQNVTFATALTSSGGALTLTNSTGSGTLTLSGVNTYSGPTAINGGALIVNGSLASGSPVSIAAGALGGSGTVNGTVTTASANAQINQEIYDILNSTVATLALGSSLNMSAGGACYLDVSTSHLSGNDEVTVAGALTLNGNTFHINALSGAAALDATGDYVLLQAGSLSGTPNSTPVWDGTPPSNSGSYIITVSGANVVLRNTMPPGPVITSAIAIPSSANRLQNVLLSVTVSNGTPPYTVTVDTSSIGGPVLSLMTNGSIHVFTNTVSLAGVADGNYSLLATATDGNSQMANANIVLTVTGVAMIWNGDASGNSFWDTAGEMEWQDGLTYQQGDFVRFDDSATGLAATNVNVLTDVAPGSIIVSNTAALPTGTYTFSGSSGQISGSTSLLKQGSGTLIIQEQGGDSFSGGISVSNGTVILDDPFSSISGGLTIAGGATAQVGNNDIGATLPSGLVTDNGTLAFNFTNIANPAFTLSSGISGSGGVVLFGSGTIAFNKASTFSGNLSISNGTLGFNTGAAGDGSSGALGNSSGGGRTITIATNATLSGTINNWFGGTGLADANFPAIVINGGTNATTRYTAIGSVTLNNGATLISSGSPESQPAEYQAYEFRGDVTVGGSSGSAISNTTGKANHLGPNTVFDVAVTSGSGPDLIVATALWNQSGDYGNAVGSLTKSGAGTMLLAGTNTYTGNTTISAGSLALNDSGSISNTPNIIVGAGAQVDVSARTDDTLTLNIGQTLSGNGTVLGNLTAGPGATVAPGSNNSIGILTITNAVNMSGTVTMKLDAATGTNDLLTGAQAIVYGGTLNVTNLAGTLGAGQTFTLFSAAGYSGAFIATNLPVLGAGMVWITTNLTVNGTISVVASVNTAPTNITALVMGGTNLVLSWPADHIGWGLQVQTNTLATGLNSSSNAWYSVPGSSGVNTVTNSIVTTNGVVFYRMVYPPLVP